MIVYECTYMSKDVEDKFEEGCIGRRSVALAEPQRIESDSLAQLKSALCEQFYLEDIEGGWGFDRHGHDDKLKLRYQRMEDAPGCPVSEKETPVIWALWKEGKATLYLVDYTFDIVCYARTEQPIGDDQFKGLAEVL